MYKQNIINEMSYQEEKKRLDSDGYNIGENCNRDECKGTIEYDRIELRDNGYEPPYGLVDIPYCNKCKWRGDYDR